MRSRATRSVGSPDSGAAARTCQKGDEIIICNAVYVTEQELEHIKPVVLTFHPDNSINERLGYDNRRLESGSESDD